MPGIIFPGNEIPLISLKSFVSIFLRINASAFSFSPNTAMSKNLLFFNNNGSVVLICGPPIIIKLLGHFSFIFFANLRL